MNIRMKKKLLKANVVTKEDAQFAWNVVARYLNKHPELSFAVACWPDDYLYSDNRYTLKVLAGEPLFVADTIWKK